MDPDYRQQLIQQLIEYEYSCLTEEGKDAIALYLVRDRYRSGSSSNVPHVLELNRQSMINQERPHWINRYLARK